MLKPFQLKGISIIIYKKNYVRGFCKKQISSKKLLRKHISSHLAHEKINAYNAHVIFAGILE